MRDIKFRAWDYNSKSMMFPTHIKINHVKGRWRPLMQYTGIKDKKGKEIYEGDILDNEYEVYFSEELAQFCYRHRKSRNACLAYNANILSVTGNIYENPELLEEI